MSTDTVRAGVIQPSSEITPGRPALRGRPVLVVVLVLVNAAAAWGQTGWGLEHVAPVGWAFPAALALALGFALALELIGVFLALMADEAAARGLASGGYRLGSYAVGLTMGGLNFSHFDGAAAFAFGFLSTVSPFLWGIYSTVRRGEPVAPSRRFWHPIDSVRLIRLMAWEGIASEDDGLRLMAFRKAPEDAPVSPARPPMTKAEIGAEAIRVRADDPSLSWEKIAAEFGVPASYLYQARKAATKATKEITAS